MNLQAKPLRDVTEIEHLWIELADGTRLAARIWLPRDAAENPVPAVLEYIPYRKRDGTAPRDESMHPYVAARGYACVRVDIRGNGESEGLMLDEYLQQELDDGIEIIEWIARQPWCSGAVGVLGISWGGFNGLQIAAMRPPALKAVITLCSTDDRYADDIHYRGGCLLNDNLSWSAAMMAYSSRPPDPQLVGEAWREMWLERLENMPFLAANWLEHQRRDDFWRHGSVCEDFSAIDIPVLAVSGWADSYTNAVPRLVAGLSGPAAGLIGPWGHKYPHIGVPGPAIDFRQEMVRWWDHWLSDRPGRDLPALRAYILDGPDGGFGEDRREGFWLAEPSWPSPNVETKSFYLASPGRLDHKEGGAGEMSVRSPLNTGLAGGRFYPKLGRADLAADQRPDDAGSLTFDGEPLAEPLDLLGAPAVELDLAVDRPQANVAVRLCHVAPDGVSHRISVGVLNLTHRDGHAEPQALEPERRYRVRVQLDDIGYRVPAGHRLRVAVSTAYWPMIWPPAQPVTVSLRTGSSRLDLPVRRIADGEEFQLAPIEPVQLAGFEMLREGQSERRVCHDVVTGETTFELIDDAGLKRLTAHGLESGARGRETYGICDRDPLSAWAKCEWSTEVGRGDWRVTTESWSAMRSDAQCFHLEAELVALENGTEVYRNRWERAIPRDLV
jgi:putative CocE/NonD family hydrolase